MDINKQSQAMHNKKSAACFVHGPNANAQQRSRTGVLTKEAAFSCICLPTKIQREVKPALAAVIFPGTCLFMWICGKLISNL